LKGAMTPAMALKLMPALVMVAALAGCATALHEPPALTAMAGTEVVPEPNEALALMARAAELHRHREVASARSATRLYLQAALDEQHQQTALMAATETLIWLTEHETQAAAREAAAVRAVDAAIWCDRGAASPGPCDYWLGAALGVQARERRSTGLSALPEIEAAFTRALAAVPEMDHGAPDRALALFYLRAPGWPGGPGDPDLGLQHAQAAMERFPGYPPNILALAEALRETGDEAAARKAWVMAVEAAGRARADRQLDAQDWVQQAEEGLRGSSSP